MSSVTAVPRQSNNSAANEDGMLQLDNGDSDRVAKQAYKERLRSSAGGGMGPNYKKDTR